MPWTMRDSGDAGGLAPFGLKLLSQWIFCFVGIGFKRNGASRAAMPWTMRDSGDAGGLAPFRLKLLSQCGFFDSLELDSNAMARAMRLCLGRCVIQGKPEGLRPSVWNC